VKYLIGSLGYPGSGKSTFLKRFAAEHQFFYWRADEARRRMFRDPKHQGVESKILNAATHYALEQALASGNSAILDKNLNQRRQREILAKLAAEQGVEFLALWVKVPVEVARQRSEDRTHGDGELGAYYQTWRPGFFDEMVAGLEPPSDDERSITIDGTVPYAEQLAVVEQALNLRGT
jgi:predicted kinase